MSKRLLIFLVLFFLFNNQGITQINESGDIFSEISNIIAAIPPGDSSNVYADPDANDLTKWDEVMTHLLAGQYADATVDAGLINYDLVEYMDMPSGNTYYLLRNNGANYWGTYVYNPNYCRPLVVQAPHPKNDFNTGKQAIHVFRETEAFFFCMSGTHRCNHANASGCSGTTTVCNAGLNNSSESFRISDMAHNTTTIFQATTQKLFTLYNNTHFISLHGFTKKNTDPYVILSNGTDQTPTTDYIVPLADELDIIDPSLTFEIAHVDNWTRLVGFTNTQGRLINSSPNDICSGNNATTTSGRFIHMEQEKTKLRADQTGWDKVADALIIAFPCMALPVEFSSPFNAKPLDNAMVQCSWATAIEADNDYFEIQKSKNLIDWQKVSIIEGAGNAIQTSSYNFIDRNPFLSTSYYRLKQVDLDGHYTYSSIQQVALEGEEINIYPNPSSGLFTIEGEASEIKSFKLYNLLNQEVNPGSKSIGKNESSYTIDLSNLPDGWYILKTKNSSHKLYKQF